MKVSFSLQDCSRLRSMSVAAFRFIAFSMAPLFVREFFNSISEDICAMIRPALALPCDRCRRFPALLLLIKRAGQPWTGAIKLKLCNIRDTPYIVAEVGNLVFHFADRFSPQLLFRNTYLLTSSTLAPFRTPGTPVDKDGGQGLPFLQKHNETI